MFTKMSEICYEDAKLTAKALSQKRRSEDAFCLGQSIRRLTTVVQCIWKRDFGLESLHENVMLWFVTTCH